MDFSRRICSRRWKRINSGLTGRSTRRRAAHVYPQSSAMPPKTTGRLVNRYATRNASQIGDPQRK